jgi:predicted DNA-binding transcriptional regulator AlpA
MPQYLSPRQVCELLGVKIVTLNRWRREHCGPRFVKLNPCSGVRYRLDDVIAWLENRSVGTPDEGVSATE